MTFQSNIIISNEQPEDYLAVERIAELAFGPGRFARTAFRLREGVPHEPDLSFICRKNGVLIASVRLTNIWIDSALALILGPLVVLHEYKAQGFGAMLMQRAIKAACHNKRKAILLVGDYPYYSKFGFEQVLPGSILMPGPVDPARLLICNLNLDENEILEGTVKPFCVPKKELL